MEPVHIYLITMFLSIPILSIAGGVVKEWLKMRGRQSTSASARDLEEKLERMLDRAGSQIKTLEKSKKELEQKLDLLETSNQEYAERIENLEAIVVSQAWNALQKSKGSRMEAPRPVQVDEQDVIIPTRPHEVSDQTPEERNRQRAANLARRTGG